MNTNNIKSKTNYFKTEKIATILTIAVLLTMSLIGNAFAKYISALDTDYTARVAYWGIGITNDSDLFANSYTGADNNSALTTVKGSENAKVIAPGTSGVTTFNLVFADNKAPEVAYKISANISGTYNEVWGGYEPLEFSIDNHDWKALDEFNTRLSTAIANNIYEPGQIIDRPITIYWRWPFNGDTVKDTDLGIASSLGQNPTINLSVKLTAEQVD
jgi:hypothetical protein